jgi:peptide/nickel transport system permease protein
MTASVIRGPHRGLMAAWSIGTGGNRSRRVGLLGVGAILLAAIAAPLLTHYSPLALDPGGFQPPGPAHLLGTDQLGRDVFARLLYGARIDLQIGVIGMLIPLVIGTIVGLVAGYSGGWVDAVIGRVIDVFVAFPHLVLVIAIVAMLGPGLVNFYIAVTVVSWTAYARIVRGETLTVRHREFVLAARTLGYSRRRIVTRHVLPNVIAPALVFAMSDVVLNILAGASLGFFGLGVPQPTPEWGSMIAEGRGFLLIAPWVAVFPGVAIITTGFFFSLLGDGLADEVRRVAAR